MRHSLDSFLYMSNHQKALYYIIIDDCAGSSSSRLYTNIAIKAKQRRYSFCVLRAATHKQDSSSKLADAVDKIKNATSCILCAIPTCSRCIHKCRLNTAFTTDDSIQAIMPSSVAIAAPKILSQSSRRFNGNVSDVCSVCYDDNIVIVMIVETLMSIENVYTFSIYIGPLQRTGNMDLVWLLCLSRLW